MNKRKNKKLAISAALCAALVALAFGAKSYTDRHLIDPYIEKPLSAEEIEALRQYAEEEMPIYIDYGENFNTPEWQAYFDSFKNSPDEEADTPWGAWIIPARKPGLNGLSKDWPKVTGGSIPAGIGHPVRPGRYIGGPTGGPGVFIPGYWLPSDPGNINPGDLDEYIPKNPEDVQLNPSPDGPRTPGKPTPGKPDSNNPGGNPDGTPGGNPGNPNGGGDNGGGDGNCCDGGGGNSGGDWPNDGDGGDGGGTPINEPEMVGLMTIGIIGLFFRRRKAN